MKYLLVIIVTAAIVFAGALVYFKGTPKISFPTATPAATAGSNVSPTSAPVPIPTMNENDALIEAVSQGLVAEHGSGAAGMTVTVSKVEGNYAKGMASEQGGGAIWFAAKVLGQWKLVWDGNGIIMCSDLDNYPGFPKDLIPECWDNTAQKLIKR